MVDDGRTDGRTPDHGLPISAPCEPNSSGELKYSLKSKQVTELKPNVVLTDWGPELSIQ